MTRNAKVVHLKNHYLYGYFTPMRWTPHATVATIVEDKGRFLFVEEHSPTLNKLVINQPAGHLEADESFIEAAKRETLEETGWHVEPETLLGMYVYKAPGNSTVYHRYCFIARAISEQPGAELDTGIERALWLTYDELAARRDDLRSPIVLKCLEDYLQGQRYPLNFIHE